MSSIQGEKSRIKLEIWTTKLQQLYTLKYIYIYIYIYSYVSNEIYMYLYLLRYEMYLFNKNIKSAVNQHINTEQKPLE